MADFTYSSDKKPARPVTFDLDGVEYTFRAPKTAKVINAIADHGQDDPTVVLSAQMQWLSRGLSPNHEPVDGVVYVPDDDRDFEADDYPGDNSPEMTTGHDERKVRVDGCQSCQIRARLDDDDDPLDSDTVARIVNDLFGKAAGGRPTGSSKGSSRSSGRTGR